MAPIAPTMPTVMPMMVLVEKSLPLESLDELLGGEVVVDAVGAGVVEEEGILPI